MSQLGQNDEVIDLMKKHGVEVTRDNYIMAVYPDGNVPEWTPELKATLTVELQENKK